MRGCRRAGRIVRLDAFIITSVSWPNAGALGACAADGTVGGDESGRDFAPKERMRDIGCHSGDFKALTAGAEAQATIAATRAPSPHGRSRSADCRRSAWPAA